MAKKNLKERATQGRKKSFEGSYYQGGRIAGRKNLKKLTNGNLQNEHGVVFTQQDKKRLESLVNSANRKRKRMLIEEAKLPRYKEGLYKGETLETKQKYMNYESDFILTRKTKSLQRFKSRSQFESYLHNLEKVNAPDYIERRSAIYKENYTKALLNTFGDDAKDVIEIVKNMDLKQFRNIVSSDEDLEIYYVYHFDEAQSRLTALRSAWNRHLEKDKYEEIE